MARKGGKDNVEVDEFGLDDFDFDIPEFDSPEVDTNSRKPITRALKGAVRGAKENIKDPATLRRAVSMAMPEGYGLAADTLDAAWSDSKELYDKISGDSPELIRSSKAFARKVKNKVNGVLPGGLSKKLDDALEDDPYSGPVKSSKQLQQEQDDSEIAALNDLLKSKTAVDEARYKDEQAEKLEGKALENARFQSSAKFLSSINRGIARLVGYQDSINLKYQQKSLELQYRQYSTTKQLTDLMAVATEKQYRILEEIKHNTALPEQIKFKNSKELMGTMARQKLLGGALNTVSNFTQNYRKQLTDNIGGMVQGFMSPLTDAKQMTEGMDKSDLAGWAIGKEASDALINHGAMALNPLLERSDKLKRGSEVLRNTFTGIPQKLNEFAQSETTATGGKGVLANLFKSFLPKFSLDARPGGTNVMDLDEPGTFDKIARRTLIEVIPGHLAEIAHWTKVAVTGEKDSEKQVYSVVRGGFTSQSENLKDVSRQIISRSEKDSIRSSTEEFLKKIGGDTLSSKAQRILKRKILDEVANGKDLKPDRLADPANYHGEDAAAVDEINSLLVDTFDLDWSGKMSDQSTEGKKKFNDIRNEFIRMASMIPAAGDRIRVLSDVVGRDNLRKLGFIEKQGREDRINYDKIWNSALDDEEDQTPPAPAGSKKAPPSLGGNNGPSGGNPNDDSLNPLPPADRAGRSDDISRRAQKGRPAKVNLEKYLGGKSLLIGILKETRDSNANAVQGLAAIHGIFQKWDVAGVPTACCGHEEGGGFVGPMPGGANGPGFAQRMRDRFGRMMPSGAGGAAGAARGWASRIGGGLGGAVGGLAGMGARGAWGAGKLAARGYWGALKGGARLGFGGAKLGARMSWGALKGLGAGAGAMGRGLAWAGGLGGNLRDRYNANMEKAEGLLGQAGDFTRDAYDRASTGAKDLAGAAKDKFSDVFLKGETHPRLLGWKLKAGQYYDEATGKAITNWNDIKGNVLDEKKKLVMKYEDFIDSGGLTDAKGKVVAKYDKAKQAAHDLANKGKDKLGGAKGIASEFMRNSFSNGGNLVSAGLQASRKLTTGGFKKVMNIFRRGKAGADLSSHMTGDYEKDMSMLALRQAQVQYDIFNLLTSTIGGKGVRKGSWQDLFSRRKEKEKEEKEAKGAKYTTGGLFAKGGLLAGLLGGKGKYDKTGEEKGEDDDGLGLDDAADLLGGGDEREGRRGRRGRGRGGRPRGKIGRLWDGTKRLAGKGLDKLGKVGKLIKGVGKVAGWAGKAAWGLTKGVFKVGGALLNNPLTRIGAKMLGRVALGAVIGAGSLLSAPVIGAAMAAWTVFEIGSWLWSRYKDRMPPLSRLRFAQYGLTPRKDTKNLDKVFALEKMFASYTRVEENGAVSINLNKIPAEQFGAIFGFKISQDDPDSMEKLAKVMKWVNARFKTVYSAHVAQVFKLTKGMDLTTVDQKVTGQPALDMLEAVKLGDQSDLFNDMSSPFDDDLTEDAGDVEDWYKSAKSDLESELKESEKAGADKTLQDGTKPLTAAETAAATAAAAKLGSNAASMAAMPKKGGNYPGELVSAAVGTGKIMPGIGLGAAVAGGAHVIAEASMAAGPDDKRLDFGNPVRYKVYGLTEMAEAKVVQLSQLETVAWPMVKYDAQKRAFIGNETELFNQFVNIFGLAGKNQDDAYVWFYRRFLVAFLKYCTAVRARSTIDAKDAVARLSNDDLLAVLKEMVGAKDESGTSVWQVTESPWEGYWLNSDSASVDANLTGLASRTPPKLLSEDGFKKADQVKNKDGTVVKQDPTQTNRPANSTSSSSTPQAAASASKDDSGGGWFSKLFGGGDDKTKAPQVGGINNRTGAPSMAMGGYSGAQGSISSSGGGGGAVGATSMDNAGSISHMGGGSAGDINAIPNPSGDGWEANKATILAAAKMVGVDPELASSIAGVESNYVPTARPYSKKLGKFLSSAAGYYQVIKGTWNSLMGRYGAKYGINPNTTAMDPRANALLGLEYVKENYDILKAKIGRKVTDTDVYLAHFLGSGGAKRFLVAPPGDPAINHVSADQAAANPTIFYDKSGRPRTVADVYNDFSNKLQKHRKPNAAQDMAALPGGAAVAASGDQGSAAPSESPGGAGGGGSFDPANAPSAPKTAAAPSMAQPSGSNISTPNSVSDPGPSPADSAGSTTKVSQAAQNIGRQAEIAELQSSSQNAAMSNSFGGVEGVLREQLSVSKESDAKLQQLVELVSKLSGGGLAPASNADQAPPSRQAPALSTPRAAPRPVVSVTKR